MTAMTTPALDHEDRPRSNTTGKLSLPWAGRRPKLLIACLVLLAIALGAAGYLALQLKAVHDEDSARSDALAAARQLAAEVTTYDYRTMDRYFARVRADSTGSFAHQYAGATSELAKLILETKSIVRGTVVKVGLQSASGNRAEVLVFVDQQVRNSALTAPTTDRNRVFMTLQRRGDRWLISDLQLL